MKIELGRKTRTILVLALLAIISWWWVHSWAAYRNVEPPTDLTKPEMQAFSRGTGAMTEHMVFKNYPVILGCALILAIIGLIPERRKE